MARLPSPERTDDSDRQESFTDISARIWTETRRACFLFLFFFTPTKSFAFCGRDVEDCTQDWQFGPSRETKQTEALWDKHCVVGKYLPEWATRNWPASSFFLLVPFYNLEPGELKSLSKWFFFSMAAKLWTAAGSVIHCKTKQKTYSSILLTPNKKKKCKSNLSSHVIGLSSSPSPNTTLSAGSSYLRHSLEEEECKHNQFISWFLQPDWFSRLGTSAAWNHC